MNALAFGCWLATSLGVAGAIANVMCKPWCFILWEIANIWLVGYNTYIGEYAQALTFAVYTIVTGWGLYDRYLGKSPKQIRGITNKAVVLESRGVTLMVEKEN